MAQRNKSTYPSYEIFNAENVCKRAAADYNPARRTVLKTGVILFVVGLGVILGLLCWGVPELKRRFIGEALQVKMVFTMSEDNNSVELDDAIVSRRVTIVDIFFPMGSEPGNTGELEVRNEKGQHVDVTWDKPEVTPLEDSRQTKWHIQYAFFPVGFQKGVLWNKTRELCRFTIPPSPYVAPAEGQKQLP
jgi:hypothetical protein